MSERNPKLGPLEDAVVAHAAADVVRKAHAVGLTDESPDFTGLTYPAVKRTVLLVREAGIGERAAGYFALATGDDTTLLAERLREISALLDESPLPATEWRRVLEVLERDQLAALLGLSPVSVSRYAKNERRTPDQVAARLHFLALVIGDLAGAYNEIGIRRWFDRKTRGRQPFETWRARSSPLQPRDGLPPRGPAPPLLLGRPPPASGPVAWAGGGSCSVRVRHAGWRMGRVSQARRDSHGGGPRHDSARSVGDRN